MLLSAVTQHIAWYNIWVEWIPSDWLAQCSYSIHPKGQLLLSPLPPEGECGLCPGPFLSGWSFPCLPEQWLTKYRCGGTGVPEGWGDYGATEEVCRAGQT